MNANPNQQNLAEGGRLIFHQQLVDEHVLLRQLILEVLEHVLRHGCPGPDILGPDHNITPELVGVALYLFHSDVGLLEEGLQDVQILLRRFLRHVDVLVELFDLRKMPSIR